MVRSCRGTLHLAGGVISDSDRLSPGWSQMKWCFCHWARSPCTASKQANGSQSHLATRACAIGNWSFRCSMLSDNSPVGVLMFFLIVTDIGKTFGLLPDRRTGKLTTWKFWVLLVLHNFLQDLIFFNIRIPIDVARNIWRISLRGPKARVRLHRGTPTWRVWAPRTT